MMNAKFLVLLVATLTFVVAKPYHNAIPYDIFGILYNGRIRDKDVDFNDCNARCLDIDYPVCGTDGKTYANECLIRRQYCNTRGNVNWAHNGNCQARDMPPIRRRNRHFNRRVSSDIFGIYDGRITDEDVDFNNCNARCLDIDYPVCGTDGKTYANECLLRRQYCNTRGNVNWAHDGDCQARDMPLRRRNTYFNRRVSSDVFHGSGGITDEDVDFNNCYAKCLKIDYPVCGTDEKTYENDCMLRRAYCLTRGKVNRNHDGKCHGDVATTCDRGCDSTKHDPKCATNGKRYQNGCYLGEAICLAKARGETLRYQRCPSRDAFY